MYRTALLVSALATGAFAQQAGTLTAETHPALPMQSCSAGGSCTTLNTKIVLDSNWRWTHSTSGATNCYTGNTWNTALCPDGVTCAANCALDGADYSGVYGITTSGGALKMNFVTGANVGSRVYLVDTDDSKYKLFKLKGQEFTFDVDVSNLPCGLNGALYFSEMEADGGVSKYPTNKAGVKYGTGYCDSQCPHDIKFINGVANSEGWSGSSNDVNSGTGKYGACCNELDIWEANKISSAYTPHPCSVTGNYKCTGTECGDDAAGQRYSGVCDKDGCDFNSYRQGNTSFYGPGLTVDTNKPITVVTQFITSDGTAAGALTNIKRFYVQNGKVIPNSVSNIAGIPASNSITTDYCTAQKSVFGDTNSFGARGGLEVMGQSMDRGQVLVLSIWDDHAVNMLWLDSTYPVDSTKPGAARGTCATTSGKPADVERDSPNASVTYSNIKIGPIGSTFAGAPVTPGNPGTPSSSSTIRSSSTLTTRPATSSSTTRPATTTTAPPTQPTGALAQKWGQCGGQGWTGPTACVAGSTCQVQNPWFSQCL